MNEPWVEPRTERRGFLIRLLLGINAIIAAVVAIPGIAFVVDPLRRRRRSRGPTRFVRLVRVLDLPEGEPRKFAIHGAEIDAWLRAPDRRLGAAWLLRRGSGVIAWTTICPHLGCGIDYRPADGGFACPCHGSAFSADGRRIEGPSPRNMDPLPTRVRDGWVEVTWRRYREGVPGRVVVG